MSFSVDANVLLYASDRSSPFARPAAECLATCASGRDLFYLEFKAFPAFYEENTERAKTFLPDNVRYEPETATLVHRYSFGGEDRTSLLSLEIAPVSLDKESIGMPVPAAGNLAALGAV